MKSTSKIVIGSALSGLTVLMAVALAQKRASPPERTGTPVSNRSDGRSFTNRLINEKSPYLQQHAHNPVDWYPWGEEAFAKARKENKSIFLSVGYSTCHWCHVMEHESFENPQIARILNDNFVCIKVDREERPDVDRVYMTFVQATTDGGMHDHIGGGFHRYATDTRWHAPHFEKMLYDQAQLACSYLEAYQTTHDKIYADVARDILAYVQRDMTGDQGQFYSAEDADSPWPGNPSVQAEGAFYVWEEKEIVEALGKDSAEIFNYFYGVEKGGNVDNDPRGEFLKKNVLIISHTVEESAQKFGTSPEKIGKILANARQRLFAFRAKRPRPHLDDKTITAWNGLMISAVSRAYQVLGDPQNLSAATKATQFVKTRLYDPKTGKLIRRYRAGEAMVDGFADDYAFLVQGLLDLYEASFDINHLVWAFDLQKKQNELFWDSTGKGFFSTTGDDPSVLLRMKEDYDGAEASPSSVAALNLLRLSQMLDEKPFREMAEKTLTAFGDRLQQAPSALPQMMVAFGFDLTKPKQIVIAGQRDAGDTRAMFRAIHEQFIPNKIVLLADGSEGQAFLGNHLQFIKDVKMQNSKATAFVCQDYVCQLPTSDVAVMLRLITGAPRTLGQDTKTGLGSSGVFPSTEQPAQDKR